MERRTFLQSVSAAFCSICLPEKKLILPQVKEIITKDELIQVPLNRVLHYRDSRPSSKRYVPILVESIEKLGLVNPILVKKHTKYPGYYELIDGLMRLHACWKVEKYRKEGIWARVIDMSEMEYNSIVSHPIT
jgi:hypothetical protein